MMPTRDEGEDWFVAAIAGYSARDLNEMMDWDISLADLIEKKYRFYLSLARLYAKKTRERNPTTSIAAGNVMIWLRVRRPDLYDAVKSHPNGTKWLEKQIEPVKLLLELS